MSEWCVYIPTWGDFDFLKEAVASVPSGIDVHIVDGRYADFPGDTIRTPGLEEWAREREQVVYHTPPNERLPWGHERVEKEPHLRHPIHDQARYANYEALPEDKWVIHIDADERFETFDVDFDELDRRWKYVPYVDSLAERGIGVPRLYVPKHWTFWIGGVMYPREFWDRETPVSKLHALHIKGLKHQYINRGELLDEIRIRNIGDDRPPEYHERRADQLETMGRYDRAEQYREMVAERKQE